MSDVAAWVLERYPELELFVAPRFHFIVADDPASGVTDGHVFINTLAYVDLLKEVRAREGTAA